MVLYSPAVSKLGANILQVCVAHVIDREDEQVVVLVHAFSDVGVQPASLFFVGFLGSFGLVDDSCALGTGHCGGCTTTMYRV